jgi:hypothetical protein
VRYGLLTSSGEPYSIEEALASKEWKAAMDVEYDALMKIKHGTWYHQRRVVIL